MKQIRVIQSQRTLHHSTECIANVKTNQFLSRFESMKLRRDVKIRDILPVKTWWLHLQGSRSVFSMGTQHYCSASSNLSRNVLESDHMSVANSTQSSSSLDPVNWEFSKYDICSCYIHFDIFLRLSPDVWTVQECVHSLYSSPVGWLYTVHLYIILLFRVEPPVTELYLTETCQLLGGPASWWGEH